MNRFLYSSLWLMVGVTTCVGQMVNSPACFSQAGGMATSASWVGFSSSGAAVGAHAGGPWLHAAGYLQTLVLKPLLDHDGDGLPDEADTDNDNDGLLDRDELLGVAFDPPVPTDLNRADSDDDGLRDGAEWVAGTSPTNTSSSLAITSIRWAGSGVQVAWQGGVTARQYLLRATTLSNNEADWTPVHTNEPPTAEIETAVDEVGGTVVFYRITAERP